jgi:hypothetical protein
MHWLSSDYMVTQADTNSTMVLQQGNVVFYAVRTKML